MVYKINRVVKTGLTALLIGTIIGCSEHPQYLFKGRIDGQNIEFSESLFPSQNRMIIIKDDGRKIVYIDINEGNDLKIDRIEITNKMGETQVYTKINMKGAEENLFNEAQRQFDEYLKKILEYKEKEALEAIK